MTLDVARARRETPACEKVIHFNNAGASLMPEPVLEATIAHLRLEAAIGGYEAADSAQPALERTYEAAAHMLNCSRGEIALVENATRAWDAAFYGLRLGKGDRVLTSSAEYGSNYIAMLQVARRNGFEIQVIPNDESGQISLEALKNAIGERVKLIALTHIPSNGGLVNPAEAVGRIARQAGVLYLLDACQSAGQRPLDVTAIGCDMLSATGRKFLRGPRGTGFLYVRREVIARLEPPFLDNHAADWSAADRYEPRPDARRFETFEGSVAGKIGLGVAIDYALSWGLDAIQERVTTLAGLLRDRLNRVRGVTLRDEGAELCGIVTFSAVRTEPALIKQSLAAQNIHVSVSPRESALLDMDARGLHELLRASVHYYNTEDEVERFGVALEKAARLDVRSLE